MKRHVGIKLLGVFFICLFNYEGLSGQTDKEQIFTTMEEWKQAIIEKDIDAIVEFYSEKFKSLDAEGKEGVRTMWIEIKEMGYLDKMEIDLTTAQLDISNRIAEFIIFDDEGELMMDFALKKDDENKWLITGVPSENCSYETYTSNYGDDCVQLDGYNRCWDIYVPSGMKGEVPLLIDIHGWDETPSHQRSISGFESLANTEGLIVVWPYGLCKSWNSGEMCCPPASEDEIDDVGFIKKLIAKVSSQYNIDSKKIYVTGLSNGCSMTQRLANEASDVITAAACMSLHLLVPKDPDYNPISVMTIMGTNDDLYNSSEGMSGAEENLEKWKTMNNCTGTYEVTWSSGNSVAWTYLDCENDTEVSLVTIDGGGHTLYKGVETEINTTKLAWDFLKRFNK